MLTILITILLDMIIYVILVGFRKSGNTVSRVFIEILICGIVLGLFAPLSGFEYEELQKEIQVGSYIEQNIIFFKYMEKDNPVILPEEGEPEQYKEKIVFLSKLTIYMEEDCKEPVLKVYRKKLRKSVWTFALLPDLDEYEIHIPLKPD